MMNEHGEDARYEFVPSPQVKAPWTVDDFDMCVTLVTKARYHRVFDNVMNRVNRIENGTQTHFAACGLSDGDYAGCLEMGKGAGAMTDASKRLRGDNDIGTGSTYAGYAVAEMSTPMPLGSRLIPETAVLPPGVASLQDWGEYKVAFGKYKKIKTYREIYEVVTEEARDYRKYLFSHYESGSPQLRDLVHYLRAMGYGRDQQVYTGPVIPGTSITRTK